MFDAKSARALAERSRDLMALLYSAKVAICAAAAQGEHATEVALDAAVPMSPGQPCNDATSLKQVLLASDREALAELVSVVRRAGYAVRPIVRETAQTRRRELVALAIDWSRPGQAQDVPFYGAELAARQTNKAAAHRPWLARLLSQVEAAASAGATQLRTFDDAGLDQFEVWEARRALLDQLQFSLSLSWAGERAELRLSW